MESPKKNPRRVRTRYTKEFKLEAVRLLQLGQKSATELALELDVRRTPASPPNPPLLPFIGQNPPLVRMTGILLVSLYS